MARESLSECPSPTVSGSGHMSFADDDVIEDEEVEQASRNIASIDSKLAIFEVFILCLKFKQMFNKHFPIFILQNKSIPLIDLQKSSNTVALVESFLGEFKPDEEGISDPVPSEKPKENLMIENMEESLDNVLQSSKEENTVIDSSITLKLNDDEIKPVELDTADIPIPEDKSDNSAKETIEDPIIAAVEKLSPTPPPPTPPVKRKV